MGRSGRFLLYSLGCPKNLVDSEWLSSRLMEAGWCPTEDLSEVDAIIVNTCSFIRPAVEESIDAILTLHQKVPEARLIVTGCLPLRYGTKLRALFPEVDTFFLSRRMEVLSATDIQEMLSGKGWVVHHRGVPSGGPPARTISTPFYTAYVKIADGCNRRCAFCTLPVIRGRYRSRPQDDIVQEVKGLVANGVKEIILVAQDTAAYGTDLGKGHTLAALLNALGGLEGVVWIKLLYLYPDVRRIDTSLVEVIRCYESICPVVDVPIQHVSPVVLKSMRRPGPDAIRRVLQRLKGIPDIHLRTTVMVGFPGETEEDFKRLCDFVGEGWFYSLGVFPYSDEEGTWAYKLSGKVPEEEKDRRVETLMGIQQEVSLSKNRDLIGSVLPVVIEGSHEETDLLLKGRTAFQFPEIDGGVVINRGTAEVGEIVPVRMTDAGTYDLVGEIVER